uniref:Uncharacterized protein n=1 Tax=Rhodosorus marinus TaxID=101924 RepID=A0A7S2ZCH1_9RHOD|mmetsp:Transcript_14650/g.59618  ORF Transcript_14650/g.59618 Transcript_14650/m.59618 type:complete len:512 (+) Transcript_14650:180-1715(+)
MSGCGFVGGFRMCGGSGDRNSSVDRKPEEGDKIHPLGQRRWKNVNFPTRVTWNPGVPPELHPETERLLELNPLLKPALEAIEKGTRRSKPHMKNMLITDWFAEMYGPNYFRPVFFVGVLCWFWYSFQLSTRAVLVASLPYYSSLFGVVAFVGGLLQTIFALASSPEPTDAVRRIMLLYAATLLGYPIVGLLGAAGSFEGALAVEVVTVGMCLGSLWFWKDLNQELRSAQYRSRLAAWFVRWRMVFTVLAALGAVMKSLVYKSVSEFTLRFYQRGNQILLAMTSPTLTLFSDPGALLVVASALGVLYIIYSLVFFAFVTDVGRYPYARKIESPFALFLLRKGILVPLERAPDSLRWTDSRGGVPSEYIRTIGQPERPGEKENLPEMEYPWLFRQLEKLESEGQFQGTYTATGSASKTPQSFLDTWAVYAEIPEDESVQDSAEIVNPARVSEQKISAILDEARQKLDQGKRRFEDGDDDDELTLYDEPDDDSVKWLFTDAGDDGGNSQIPRLS